MNQPLDPIEALKAARPQVGRLDFDSDPVARSILQRVLDATDDPVRRMTRRARRVTTFCVVALLATAGTAAAIALRHDKPRETRTLGCWSAATTPTAPEIVVVEWNGTSPVALCQEVWRKGLFDTQPASEPPPLTACVDAGGALAVMPGDERTCGVVGLAGYDATAAPEADSIRNAITAIESELTSEACLSATDAEDLVRRVLGDTGLDDWTVVPPPDPFPSTEPCASAGFDVETKTIYVVPIARPSG